MSASTKKTTKHEEEVEGIKGKKMDITVIHPGPFQLGEGVHWNAVQQTLAWVDIIGSAIAIHKECRTRIYPVPFKPSAIWCIDSDSVRYASARGIDLLRLSDGAVEELVKIEADRPDTRSNDGGVAPDGSFWFGTMALDAKRGHGSLYRVDKDFSVRRMAEGLSIPNTFLFRSLGRELILADSADGVIYRWFLDYDGTITGRTIFSIAEQGEPDGSCMLSDGRIVNARWDAGHLAILDSIGDLLGVVNLPVIRPTSCTVCNEESLIITSAAIGLDPISTKLHPYSGAVISIPLNQALDAMLINSPTPRKK